MWTNNNNKTWRQVILPEDLFLLGISASLGRASFILTVDPVFFKISTASRFDLSSRFTPST
jgi:hypothetical protein